MANCVEMPHVVKKKQATTHPKKNGVFMAGGVDMLGLAFASEARDTLLFPSSSKISTASILYVLARVRAPPSFPATLMRLFLPLGAFCWHSARMSPRRMKGC